MQVKLVRSPERRGKESDGKKLNISVLLDQPLHSPINMQLVVKTCSFLWNFMSSVVNVAMTINPLFHDLFMSIYIFIVLIVGPSLCTGNGNGKNDILCSSVFFFHWVYQFIVELKMVCFCGLNVKPLPSPKKHKKNLF